MKLYISTGNSRMEKKWNGQEMEFSVFLERLSHTVRTSETMEQYRKLSKAKQDSIKDVGGFVLGKLKGGRRKKDCVISRSAITTASYSVVETWHTPPPACISRSAPPLMIAGAGFQPFS